MIKRIELWLWVPVITVVIGLLLIGIIRPLWGTDFTGGSLLEMKVTDTTNPETVTEVLKNQYQLTATVQITRDNTLFIRTTPLDEATHRKVVGTLQEQKLAGEELRFESIGPTIGNELRRKAWLAIVLAVGGIMVYLTYTFRQTVGVIAPWKFGVAASYALLHDLVVVTALFVIFGKTQGVTIDTLFVTAMLSIMAYSVNDTIVIFDRLREEWQMARTKDLRAIMDRAVSASLLRSLNTSFTILLVLIAMLVLGGSTIRWFIVALIAGTISGTYSSIFVATPALYFLAKKRR